jgi:pilus assembly protein Flp/PilA
MSKTIISKTIISTHVHAALRAFRRDDSGATAIEYSLIAGFIFLVIVTPVSLLGPSLTEIFQKVVAGFP